VQGGGQRREGRWGGDLVETEKNQGEMVACPGGYPAATQGTTSEGKESGDQSPHLRRDRGGGPKRGSKRKSVPFRSLVSSMRKKRGTKDKGVPGVRKQTGSPNFSPFKGGVVKWVVGRGCRGGGGGGGANKKVKTEIVDSHLHSGGTSKVRGAKRTKKIKPRGHDPRFNLRHPWGQRGD